MRANRATEGHSQYPILGQIMPKASLSASTKLRFLPWVMDTEIEILP